MSKFKKFKQIISQRLENLTEQGYTLYTTNVDKDKLWDKYLNSFDIENNPIFRERTEHDCSCCRSFIKRLGGLIIIIDNKKESIWRVEANDFYQKTADVLAEYVEKHKVNGIFLSKEQKIGTDNNKETTPNGIITWQHFYHKLDNRFVNPNATEIIGEFNNTLNVVKRTLKEFSLEHIQELKDLIDQGILYRGEQHKEAITNLLRAKKQYLKAKNKELFCLEATSASGRFLAIRNTSIGQLLVNRTEGDDLETAVRKYETIVAPVNYKRPKAIYTKRMIEDAQKKLVELGFENSLNRRFAQLTDVNINDVLWANRNVKPIMKKNIFDQLIEELPVKNKFRAGEMMTIERFIDEILPTAQDIQIYFDNKNKNNLVSLITSKEEVPSMFKWNNNFSWTYNNNVTDSIRDKVIARGGNVDAPLRFSISWADNVDDNSDLDAHARFGNSHIYFSNMSNQYGRLDVDITQPKSKGHKNIVENIYIKKLQNLEYIFEVKNYALRGNQKGFTAQIEINGEIHDFRYNKALANKQVVQVAKVTHKDGKFTVKPLIESNKQSVSEWNINTLKFHPVNAIMFSPNYWEEQTVGHKHIFFMLQNCINDTEPRGFFNEYLNQELNKHRKVFEALSSKMTVDFVENQMSGLGFVQDNYDITLKVDGKIINLTNNKKIKNHDKIISQRTTA